MRFGRVAGRGWRSERIFPCNKSVGVLVDASRPKHAPPSEWLPILAPRQSTSVCSILDQRIGKQDNQAFKLLLLSRPREPSMKVNICMPSSIRPPCSRALSTVYHCEGHGAGSRTRCTQEEIGDTMLGRMPGHCMNAVKRAVEPALLWDILRRTQSYFSSPSLPFPVRSLSLGSAHTE